MMNDENWAGNSKTAIDFFGNNYFYEKNSTFFSAKAVACFFVVAKSRLM